jgi:hypothetical protein
MARSSRSWTVRSTVVGLSLALATLGIGCGSSQPAPTTANTAVKLSAPTRLSDTWPLVDHVVTPAAFPGFVRPQRPTVIWSPAAWAAIERSTSPARETARLRALGFEQAIDEELHGRFPLSVDAISIVERYRTPAGARAELSHQYAQLVNSPGVEVSRFPVGIPSARAVRTMGGGFVGLNVLFSVGPYYYIVAAGYPSGAPGAPTPARLIAAAGSLYLAVTGCAAPASPGRAS